MNEELIGKVLSGEASRDEKSQLKRWISADKQNQEKFEHFRQIWELYPLPDANKAWNAVKLRINQKADPSLTRRSLLKVAATLIIVLGMGYLTGKLIVRNNRGYITEQNLTDSVKSVQLPDGSDVILNAHASLRYGKDFGLSNRDLSLSGEAFFQVTPNPDLPFVISAQEAVVTVTGTSFSVNTDNELGHVEVIVESGSVEVYPKSKTSQRLVLQKGLTGIYDAGQGKLTMEVNNDENFKAWFTRELVFRDTPLSQVVTTINKAYRTNLKLATDGLGNCRFTGNFTKEREETVLQILREAFHLQFQTTGEEVFITGTPCTVR